MVSWTEVEPARSVGRAITAAIRSALLADAPGYVLATAPSTRLHSVPAGSVVACLVRLLLEETHPAGLDADDIQAVVDTCTAQAATWLPTGAVSVPVLVAVLSSSLGVHEAGVTYVEALAPDVTTSSPAIVDDARAGRPTIDHTDAPGARPPTPAEYAWHAPLIITALLPAGGRRLDGYLDAAFAEIARAEEMEMP